MINKQNQQKMYSTSISKTKTTIKQNNHRILLLAPNKNHVTTMSWRLSFRPVWISSSWPPILRYFHLSVMPLLPTSGDTTTAYVGGG